MSSERWIDCGRPDRQEQEPSPVGLVYYAGRSLKSKSESSASAMRQRLVSSAKDNGPGAVGISKAKDRCSVTC